MSALPLRSLLAVLAFVVATFAARADVFFVPDATSGNTFRISAAGVKTTVSTTGVTTPEQVALDALGSPAVGGGSVAFKNTLLTGVVGVADSNAASL